MCCWCPSSWRRKNAGIRNLVGLLANGALLCLFGWWLYLGSHAVACSRASGWMPPAFLFFSIVSVSVLAVLALGPIGWRYRITIDGVP